MKTKNVWLVLGLLFQQILITAQVGVNIVTPHPTAAMQIENPAGFNKGLLTPSMTTTQRLAVNTGTLIAADGLVVYDVSYKMHFMFNAANKTWVSMSPLTLSTPSNAAIPNSNITTPATMSTTAFNVGINTQNPTQALDVVGNTTVSGNAAIGGSLNVAGFATNALVPTGLIAMWSGVTPPTGWGLCNGSTYTTSTGTIISPDLRGRFIVASGTNSAPAVGDINPNYTTGSIGGENLHTLTTAQIPKHNHALNADGSTVSAGGGAHGHSVYAPSGMGNSGKIGGNTGNTANTSGQTLFTSTNDTHSHSTSDFAGNTGDGTSAGLNNQAHENRPPYYVLAFIIKLP